METQPHLLLDETTNSSLWSGTSSPSNPSLSRAELVSAIQRRNVYVSGLPETFSAADFRQLCQKFGRVEASKLCVDGKCRPTKGYGFALFFEEVGAMKCIQGLNGHPLNSGRPLQARLADHAATPAPLDPTSAHPPISRVRAAGSGRWPSRPGSVSLGNSGALLDASFLRASNMSISREDMSPHQFSVAPIMVQPTTAPASVHSPLTQSHAQTPDQGTPVGYSLSPFPPAAGCMPLATQYVAQQPMGVPIFVAVPPSVPSNMTQQLVMPATMVTQSNYMPHLHQSVMYTPSGHME
ncbi:putative RNA-binding protein RBP10 [Trypanosoma vivax]|nr:putative RNA-binding protein RBP10 [Trypanosoma vivax]